jgi:hypothetical protein
MEKNNSVALGGCSFKLTNTSVAAEAAAAGEQAKARRQEVKRILKRLMRRAGNRQTAKQFYFSGLCPICRVPRGSSGLGLGPCVTQ